MQIEPALHTVAGGVRIKLRVHPGAKHNGIAGNFADALKLELQTPPVDGKANAALIKLFAQWLDTSRSNISIVAGLSSRDKVLEVTGINVPEIIEALSKHGL